MSTSFSLSSRVEVFPCPNCKETINTTMQVCPFCSAALDHSAAVASAEAFAEVNQACSDGSYLKIMAGSAAGFFLLRFVPFIAHIGIVGFWFLCVAVPFMVIRWFVKFGAIRTDDQEFTRARSAAFDVGIGAAIFLLFVAVGVLRI